MTAAAASAMPPYLARPSTHTTCCCHRPALPFPPLPALQDYPEHRLQFFSLLRAITNHCSTTLFAMSPVGGWAGLGASGGSQLSLTTSIAAISARLPP